MTDKATLLAKRVEKADADETASLLIEAFDLTNWRSKQTGNHIKNNVEWFAFDKLIRAKGYLDAALSLVPEGWAYGQGRGTDRSDTDGWAWVSPTDEGEIITAATPALALASASLRAIANKEQTT